MKSNGFIKCLAPFALLLLGAGTVANAQTAPMGMVLVAGTDFSAPGYEDNTYVGFDETTQEGLADGSFSTGVLRIDKDPKADGVAWDYETGASDFHDSPHYAVTNNPIKLDSAAYMDMGEKNWYMVFSTPNALSKEPLFKYSANGFKPGSPVSVAIKFCRLIDTDGQIVGQKANNGGICQYEPLQGKVRVNYDFMSQNIHKDKDLSIDKTGGCQEVTVSTVASASGEVIVDFMPQFNSSCCAYFIDYIYIYGSIDPKVIAPESEVCAGGERVALSLDRVYRDVKYQWYKGNSAISGATEPSYSHESGKTAGTKTTYYCEITTSSGAKVKSKEFTVTDIECCSDEKGNPTSRKLIWKDDFGTATSPTNYWTWDYSKISAPKKVTHTDGTNWQHALPAEVEPQGADYHYVKNNDDGKCADGEKFIENRYTVAGNVTAYGTSEGACMGWVGYFGNGKGPNENKLAFAPDHTYGDDHSNGYGCMLFLNIGAEAHSIIYSRKIEGLCDRKITVQCFVNNFSAGTKPVKVYVKLTDPLTGKSEKSESVERYAQEVSGLGWLSPKATIQLTGTELLFEIVSEIGNAPGQSNDDKTSPNNDGNDLILDDILIYACASPSVNLYFDLPSHLEETKSCDGNDENGDAIKLYVEETQMIKTNLGDDARYLYQYTVGDPEDLSSWVTLGTAPTKDIIWDDIKKAVEAADFPTNDKVYFRVVMGSETALTPVDQEFNPNEPCGSYSVSEPILLNIECPDCTEPASKIKIKSDKTASDKKNKKDVIALCYGESVTLSQAADITPAQTDWASPDFSGFAIKWFKDTEKPGLVPANSKGILNDVIEPLSIAYDDASLGGTEMPVVLYAVDALYPDGTCKTGDTIYIRFNPVPDAEFRNPNAEFCQGEGSGLIDMTLTKGVASDYTIHWWKGADTITGTSLGDDLGEAFFEKLESKDGGMFSYQLVDNETGCEGEVHNYEVIVNPIPEAPKPESIQYTINGNSNEVMGIDKFTQTLDPTLKLLWFNSETEPNSKGSFSVVIDRSVATPKDPKQPYVFYIAYKDGDCYSERSKVEVEVLEAPEPTVRKIDLCKDGTYDAMDGIEGTDTGYELIWFRDPVDTAGKALSSAPADLVDITTPGVYTLYVAQRATTTPFAQSSVASFTVTVYDVKAPVDASKHEYCAYDEAEELKATLTKDEANYYGADEIVYVSGTSESSTYIPNTKVSTSQKYEYKAYQKFTTPMSNKECKGPSIDITVDVVAVAKPEVNHSVSYVKSEAAAPSYEFLDILDKSPDAITDVANQTLLWAKTETDQYLKGSTSSSKPTYDPSAPVGVPEKQKRWVKWQATTASGLTCESEPADIDIIISSTPAPKLKKIEICEEVFKSGTIPSDKEPANNAEVNDNYGNLPDANLYKLVWFDNQTDADNAMKSAADVAKGSKTAPSLTEVFSGVDMSDETVPKWTKSLYAVQSYDDGNGNVTTSPATEMQITVNATPKLQPIVHDPVCDSEGPVNLTDNKYWNVSNGVSVVAEYMNEAGTSVTDKATSLTEAGEYTIVATSSLGCKSDPLKLQLDIRKLSISMVPTNTTCPETAVSPQDVEISFSYNKNGAAAKAGNVKLSWTSEEKTSDRPTNSGTAGAEDQTFRYESGSFGGKAGDLHTITITMTDGSCTATTKQTVEIGDGPAGGSYTWKESDNESIENGKSIPLTSANKDNIEINACGGPVTVDFSQVERTDDDVKWYKTKDYTSPYKTGLSPIFTQADYGTYYVRYTNKCYAYATVTINDASVTISTMSDYNKVMCEDNEYTKEIEVKCFAKPTREWYKNGDLYANNSDGLSFVPVKKKDEGVYRVEYRYDGCKAELDVVDLKVKEYVKFDADGYEMYEGKKSYIVIAGNDTTVPFKFTVPTDASDISKLVPTVTDKSSQNAGTLATDNSSFDVTNVDEDHIVHVEFESDDYCMGDVDFQVLRDAKLVLKADVETAMCLNEEKPFTIDTIGTGAFRRPGAKLEVIATPENGTGTQEKGFSVVADILKKNISPRVTTTYDVTFTYGKQKVDTSITVIVYNFKVEPINEVICSGEQVKLKATVSPIGSRIEWFDEDKTTLLGDDSIMVSPVFDGPVSAAKSQHKYWARPYSDLVTCTSSGMTPLLVDVYRPLEGEIEDKTICEGDNVRIDAGSYGATTYIWIIDGDSIKGSRYYQDTPSQTTTYQVYMTRGNVCEAEDEATVTVTTKPVITSIDSVGYRDVDIVMDPTFGTPKFRYSIDGGDWTEDTHITGLKYTIHTIEVKDDNGCVLKDTFVVKEPALVFPIHFSPNDDGESDHWTVPGIQETYPEAEFTIYDRWGKKLVQFKGEDDGWDGSYNGVNMPSTDYWYECIIREIDKVYKGHFTLIRR